MLHIINRGFYSLRDAATPLKWTALNLLINLIVELPLLWTSLRESGMPVGTLVSFSIQAVAMLWILDRRLDGIGFSKSWPAIWKMIVATLLMLAVCLAIRYSPIYPGGERKIIYAVQLLLLVVAGSATYFISCMLMGIDVTKHLRRRKR
jgi:putative peptidoglycan lipid II flippase